MTSDGIRSASSGMVECSVTSKPAGVSTPPSTLFGEEEGKDEPLVVGRPTCAIIDEDNADVDSRGGGGVSEITTKGSLTLLPWAIGGGGGGGRWREVVGAAVVKPRFSPCCESVMTRKSAVSPEMDMGKGSKTEPCRCAEPAAAAAATGGPGTAEKKHEHEEDEEGWK